MSLFSLKEFWSLLRHVIAALIIASLLLIADARGAERFLIDPAHAFVFL
jgi:hypothetical protein